jgi:hypothetical protein
LGQEPRNELPLDAVPGSIERRGKSPESALARRDGNDTPADPALARQPDLSVLNAVLILCAAHTSSPTTRMSSSALLFVTTPGRRR